MSPDYFGKAIKEYRQVNNLTQQNLADILSVTPSAISKWENGKNLPDLELLLTICSTLDISTNELSIVRQDNQSSKVTSPSKEKKKQAQLFANPVPFLLLLLVTSLFLNLYLSFRVYGQSRKLSTLSTSNLSINHSVNEVASRMVLNSNMEENIYEVAFVIQGDISFFTSDSDFLYSMQYLWNQDTNVSSDIKTKKISFYYNDNDAKSWNTPQRELYIYR